MIKFLCDGCGTLWGQLNTVILYNLKEHYLNVTEVPSKDSDWLDVISAPQASGPIVRATHEVETKWTAVGKGGERGEEGREGEGRGGRGERGEGGGNENRGRGNEERHKVKKREASTLEATPSAAIRYQPECSEDTMKNPMTLMQ